ncbi:unnamed protein product [marine sediment metagenome]|uniref:Uncharacterized protein n=1 Tax=marine sediment metagenome TaxID=412755 RepID=X0Y669_9ZZZZ
MNAYKNSMQEILFTLRTKDEPTEVTVTNGLYYERTHKDQGVYIVYDRDTGRGYYEAHSR